MGRGVAPQRLPRIVGASRAKELIFTGRRVGGEEAQKLMLADHVVPDDQVRREEGGGRAGVEGHEFVGVFRMAFLRACGVLAVLGMLAPGGCLTLTAQVPPQARGPQVPWGTDPSCPVLCSFACCLSPSHTAGVQPRTAACGADCAQRAFVPAAGKGESPWYFIVFTGQYTVWIAH